ncbi:MAG: DUF2183 domain-containing protein [Saprospiraceae bacterium]|nr:DUF2183 domain-containing protein [Saprospiraceae bacterium]
MIAIPLSNAEISYFHTEKKKLPMGQSGLGWRLMRSVKINLRRMISRGYALLGIRFTTVPAIIAYRGYGRADQVFLKGRILQNRSIFRSEDKDTAWQNFVKTLRRFNSHEVSGAELEVRIGDNVFEVKSDVEGYFHLEANLPKKLTALKTPWASAQITLRSPSYTSGRLQSPSDLLLPKNAGFGIISDIDDTILKTDVTSLLKLKMLYLTFLKNASSRKAFREVGAFYQALERGPKEKSSNPFFYVSNSPWNLYDLLEDFLIINDLPKGPILLRDFGIPYQSNPVGYKGHKYEHAARIMQTYPHLPFVLIGDSGENDADIYLELSRAFPGQVRAIYIRDVRHIKRSQRVSQLIREVADVDIRLIPNYREAALHAADKGLISKLCFDRLRKK